MIKKLGRRIFSWSIRTQLMILVLVAVLPALTIILRNGFELKHSKVLEAHERSLSAARNLAVQQAQITNSTRQILSTLARIPQVQKGDSTSCDAIFHDLVSQNPAYLIISIANVDGIIFASSHPHKNYSVADRKFFQDAVGSRKFSVGEYVVSRATKLPALHFAYPIMTRTGHIRAVLIAALNLNVYRQFLSDEFYLEGYVIGITDHKGIRLYRYPDTESELTGVGVVASDTTLRNLFRPDEEGIYEGVGSDGTYRLYAYKKLRLDADSPPYGYVFVGASRNVILADANRELNRSMILFGLAILLALAAAWGLGNRSFVNRLKKLADASHRLTEGDLKAKTGLPEGNDEISYLAKTFDNMSAAFERQESERKQAEEQVKESQRRLSEIIEFLPDATLVIDREGRVIAWNRAIEAMTGIKAKAMLGKGNYEYAVPFYGNKRPILIDLALQADTGQEKKYTAIRKIGDILFGEAFAPNLPLGNRHLSATASVLRNANGEVTAAIECIRDNTERKLLEEKLVESEKQYRNLVDNTPGGVFQTHLNGRILFGNQEFVNILRFDTLDELMAANVARFYKHPEERQLFLDAIQTSRKVKNFEIELVTKDGLSRDIMISAVLEGDIITGTLADITERKQAENALRESEKRYRYLFENMLSGYAYCRTFYDRDTPRDFAYIDVNSAFEKLTGLKDVIGKNVSDVIPGVHESNPELLRIYGRVAMTGRSERFETYVAPLATWFSVSVYSPEKEYFVAVFDNITDHKRADDELRRHSEEISDLYNHAPCGYHSLDANGTYMRINDTQLNLSGYSREDLIGKKKFSDLMTPESRETFKINYPLFKERGWIKDVEYQLIRKDGTILPVILNATAIKDSEGNFLQSRASLFDNTERKQAEEARKGLEERLQRAEKMESLGMLAGGVAHDLNNVLGILVGYSELIADEIDESSPIRPHIRYIRQGGERAAAIVQDLLTLARRGVQAREVVNINAIIDDAVKSPEFEKLLSFHSGVRFKTELDTALLNIKGSPIHLNKTLMNLVSNATEAMKAGGLLTIRTCNEYLDRPVQGYDTVREGDYVVLRVSDMGEGISASDMKRIFEPFYTKKVMGRSGTGLGLAVVWGTAKDHDGYINVESEEGKGTTFTLYFPVTRDEIPGERRPLSVTEYSGKGESILVIDDVEGQRHLAAQMLKKLNYTVAALSSGEEAVEYLKKSRADLIVLDMIMDPGMDGLDTYKIILEMHPKQKAIIVSGFAETERVRQAQALGAGAYVRKPYAQERLGLAVRKELDKSA